MSLHDEKAAALAEVPGTGFADFSRLAIATRSWGALSLDLNGGDTWTALGPTDGVTEPTAAVRAGWQVAFRPGVLLAGAIGTGYGRDAAEAPGAVGLTIILLNDFSNESRHLVPPPPCHPPCRRAQAMISFTMLPCTSVSRKSRPA